LYAIDDDDLARIGDAQTDAEVRAIVAELEARWEPGFACELDEAWDAIHRVLTDGRLVFGNGRPPLSLAILGGRRLHDGDEMIVTVKAPDEVQAIADALARWDYTRFRRAYYKLPRDDYGELDEDDLGYVWAYFRNMTEFWREAAAAERAVVFSAEP
jgi:hypothetical protein